MTKNTNAKECEKAALKNNAEESKVDCYVSKHVNNWLFDFSVCNWREKWRSTSRGAHKNNVHQTRPFHKFWFRNPIKLQFLCRNFSAKFSIIFSHEWRSYLKTSSCLHRIIFLFVLESNSTPAWFSSQNSWRYLIVRIEQNLRNLTPNTERLTENVYLLWLLDSISFRLFADTPAHFADMSPNHACTALVQLSCKLWQYMLLLLCTTFECENCLCEEKTYWNKIKERLILVKSRFNFSIYSILTSSTSLLQWC